MEIREVSELAGAHVAGIVNSRADIQTVIDATSFLFPLNHAALSPGRLD